jgi:hypothetical protein
LIYVEKWSRLKGKAIANEPRPPKRAEVINESIGPLTSPWLPPTGIGAGAKETRARYSRLSSFLAESLELCISRGQIMCPPSPQALISQIGLLKPDVATDVVLFCNMLEGLRIDLKGLEL